MFVLLGCDPPSTRQYVTIENKRNESIKVFVDGELQGPTIVGKSTCKLTNKQFVSGSIGVVAKSAKDGTEVWEKNFSGSTLNEIRKGDELYIVVPDSK